MKKLLWACAFSAVISCLSATRAGEAKSTAPANLPKIMQPVQFNTAEADQILAAMQLLPANNAWYDDISKRPVLPNSEKMIANISATRHFGCNWDMGFVIVPAQQPKVAVKLVDYPDESDKGPYPLPENVPIEGWPRGLGGQKPAISLQELQRKGDGDRHGIVLDPTNRMLYEFYQLRKTDAGWQAACEATFNLASNKLRPAGWTSSDAAGLPIFSAIVRYDELERGIVAHAVRVTVQRSRKAFIYPATHQAGSTTDADFPAMGERLRLKASVNVSSFPKHAKAIALAMQKYGLIVADNGSSWLISVAPDERIKDLQALYKLHGSDFEVIQGFGEKEGPRAP